MLETYTKIPTSWNDVKIKQQLAVEKIAKENPDFKSLAIVAGYTGVEIDAVKRMPFNEVKNILEKLTFISTPLPNEPISEFEFKGEHYSVMPTLLKSETQDFLTLTSVEGRSDALLYVVAVLAKKRKGNGEFESLSDFNIDERARHFEDLPLPLANRIHVFFCLTNTLLLAGSKQMLDQYDQSIKQSIDSLQTTLNEQVGGGLSTRLLKATLQSYLKYLKHLWKQQYSGYNSRPQKQNWITRFKELFKKKRRRS